LKISVLTTNTSHHIYFVKKLQEIFGRVTVICETRARVLPFETHHPFENLRDEFEWDNWFNSRRRTFTEYTNVYFFPTINDKDATSAIKKENSDLVIVFGTSLLKDSTIRACSPHIFNLHGGDPENYRGLDSHLWAIYHRDFKSLVTTIHRIDSRFDTGEIVLQAKVPLTAKMHLHELRTVNTEICVQLAVATVDMYIRYGGVTSRPQRKMGRYYSAMPTQLKSVCCYNFEKYINSGLVHET
jgi:methionyl-tRNA formyltransferase